MDKKFIGILNGQFKLDVCRVQILDHIADHRVFSLLMQSYLTVEDSDLPVRFD